MGIVLGGVLVLLEVLKYREIVCSYITYNGRGLVTIPPLINTEVMKN